MKRIVIFASGSGTNAENIIRYFQHKNNAVVEAVFCNNPQAKVIERAKQLNTPCMLFTRIELYDSDKLEKLLVKLKVDLIVLAGFLWKIPEKMIQQFPGRIINIHPALLPSYGGKGFYGKKVHDAVIASGDKKSGITIHFVNEKYDDGQIIFQAVCDVGKDESAETLAAKIHVLEQKHFPAVIDSVLEKLN